jgi:hypothetical protein
VPRTYGGGSGTLAAPYRISTAEHLCTLAWYRADHDKYFLLTADLDMTRASTPFFPIGLKAMPFTGVFDGNNCTISHLRYASDEDYVGLFSALHATRPSIRSVHIAAENEQKDCGEDCIRHKGCIANLNLEDVDIQGHDNVAALVAYNDGTICGCSAAGSVTGQSNVGGLVGDGYMGARVCRSRSACRVQGQTCVGGLVGSTLYGTISTSAASGEVWGQEYVGGLVGRSAGTISMCRSEARVQGDKKAGGLVGENSSAELTCSHASGTVTGTSQVGGATGFNNGKMSYCYAAGLVKGQTETGGLTGARYMYGETYLCYWDLQTSQQPTSMGGTGKTTAQMKSLATYRGWGACQAWTMEDGRDYPRLAWEGKPGVSLAEVPWLYAGGTGEPNDPFRISTAEHLTAIGYRVEDYDKCFVLEADLDLSKVDPNTIVPIGDTIHPFTGIFDGRNHVIRGFRRTWSQGTRAGLFGFVQTPSWLLRNDALQSMLAACSAGASASNLGILRGCVINLHLRDVDVEGGDTVGALVGECGGIVLCCSVDGRIAGAQQVGAMSGYSHGYLVACKATGHVDGGEIVGGLTGVNAGQILCCYSVASVLADKTAGGLVGRNAGHVAWSLAIGPVLAPEEPGGLCGAAANGSVYLSCWNVETSGCRTSQGARAATSEQLRDVRTYQGWGYSRLWRVPSDTNTPQLIWESRAGQVIADDPRRYDGGTGSADDPYQIRSVENLLALGRYPEDLDKHFVLAAELDLSGADPNAFVPIGTTILPFTGVFDGNDHGIIALTYPHPGESCVGVFGSVLASDDKGEPGGLVRNLGVQSINIQGGDRVGGLVGLNGGALMNCHVTGRVRGNDRVGGLTGTNEAGGSILHCTCDIAVEADADVGGLAGYNEGNIEAGGVKGSVTGTYCVGGLLGNNWGTVTQAFADTSVTGGARTGGLAGQSYRGTIESSYSRGSVDGGQSGPTGGLIGYNYDVVSHCYSACIVRSEAHGDLGSLIGMDWWGEVQACFWDSTLSSGWRGVGWPNPYPGGVTGLPTTQMQTAATFIDAGWDFVDTWTICEGKDYPRFQWEGATCDE